MLSLNETEKGYTLIESLLATSIFVILILPIFYLSVQGINNFTKAKYQYIATLDAQNILEEIKEKLDRDQMKESLFDEDLITNLNLNITKFNYEVQIINYITKNEKIIYYPSSNLNTYTKSESQFYINDIYNSEFLNIYILIIFVKDKNNKILKELDSVYSSCTFKLE